MRRISTIAVWIILFTGFVYFSNCSRPLDINDIGQGSPDTIFVTDTLYSDSVIVDTLVVDTLIIDTLIIDTLVIDTLYFDSSRVDTMYCGRLDSHRHNIVWLLFNDEGLHELEFLGAVEGITCIPNIIIEVDGECYTWDISEGTYYSIEQFIEPYAMVKISTDPPHAYGRSIDICMRVTKK